MHGEKYRECSSSCSLCRVWTEEAICSVAVRVESIWSILEWKKNSIKNKTVMYIILFSTVRWQCWENCLSHKIVQTDLSFWTATQSGNFVSKSLFLVVVGLLLYNAIWLKQARWPTNMLHWTYRCWQIIWNVPLSRIRPLIYFIAGNNEK